MARRAPAVAESAPDAQRGRAAAWAVLVGAVAVGLVEGAVDLTAVGTPAARARALPILAYAVASWLLPAAAALAAALVLVGVLRLLSFRPGPFTAATLAVGLLGGVGGWLSGLAVFASVLLGLGLVLGARPVLLRLLGRRPGRRLLQAGYATALAFAGVTWLLGEDDVTSSRSTGARAVGKPNIVLIVADALRADSLSCYGGQVPTPHIDSLGEHGWLIPDVLAASSWTLPSVASLWTSLSPRQHGVTSYAAVLPDHVPLLSDALARAGWRTGAVLANPLLDPERGFGRGFDVVRGDTRLTEANLFWVVRLNRLAVRNGWISGPNAGQKLVLPTITAADGLTARRTGYLAGDEVTNRALDLVDRWSDQSSRDPFFLYLHYFDPHDPYLPHPTGVLLQEPPFEPEQRDQLLRLYAGEVAFLDQQIGRLLEGLEARGVLQNALVVFTSDHGEEFLDHGGWLHKATLYDELVRVPLLMRFPGVPPRPAPARASLADVAPTILAAVGAVRDEEELASAAAGSGAALFPPASSLDEAAGLAASGAIDGQRARLAERIQDGTWMAAVRGGGLHWIVRLPADLLPTREEFGRWAAAVPQPAQSVVAWSLDGDDLIVPEGARAFVAMTDVAGPDGSRALRIAAGPPATPDNPGTPAIVSRPFALERDGVLCARFTVMGNSDVPLRAFLEQQDGSGAGAGWKLVAGSLRDVQAGGRGDAPGLELAAGSVSPGTPVVIQLPPRRAAAGVPHRLVFQNLGPLSAGESWVVDDVHITRDDPRGLFDVELYDLAVDPAQQRNLFTPHHQGWPDALRQVLEYAALGDGRSERPLSEFELERLRAMGYVK